MRAEAPGKEANACACVSVSFQKRQGGGDERGRQGVSKSVCEGAEGGAVGEGGCSLGFSSCWRKGASDP